MYALSCAMQLLNVKKFLQKVHSNRTESSTSKKLLLSPDLFIECGDIVLQITDDPFEVKLKANYEVYTIFLYMRHCMYHKHGNIS